MTEVAFHFNVPQKLVYACRVLRKARRAGTTVGVVGPSEVLRELDVALWSFSALDFIPHCWVSASGPVRTHSPIVLAEDAEALPAAGLLVNVGPSVPVGFERFERLIELVGNDESDRVQARPRWRHYANRGYAIVKHDLALKG